jgi:hypothetical protein
VRGVVKVVFNIFGKKEKAVNTSSRSKLANEEQNLKIKEYVDKLNTAATTEEKVLIAKFLLENTDIVKSENVLCQFDDEKWYSEKNYLKKYLEYKSNTSSTYYGVDCDVSILCVVMYALLNDKLRLNDIVNQHSSKQKYEIRSNDGRFKGDTLTSALHLLKLYLGCLWKRIDSNDQLKRIKKYKDFHGLFHTIARTGVPVALKGDWNSYCYQYSDMIWNAMDEEAKDFFKSYNMFGNYMCIPGHSYQISGKAWTSFNMSRSNKGKWDTVDTLLVKIYGYYQYYDVTYLEAIFTDKKNELTEETLKWLAGFESWLNFVDKNALQPFVDKTTLIPISLKTGKPIKINEAKTYDAIPKNYKEFLTFFTEVSKRIVMRNEYIYTKLSS